MTNKSKNSIAEASPACKQIRDFNQGRIPELLRLKYKAMRANSFGFFRGSCHLFYADYAAVASKIKDPTKAWICGDLHLENFGTFKGDNRAVYFDMNDFDEAILAPCTWEIARALTSIHLAARTSGFSDAKAELLCASFVDTYAQTLATGKAGSVEKSTVRGLVKKFLIALQSRKRETFIQSRTVVKKGKIRLNIDHRHALPISHTNREKLIHFMDVWRGSRNDRKFFKVLDVAVRIAGTGSLGVERYVILVWGNGPGEHYLLDLKTASPSCITPHITIKQPFWSSQAERITEVQKRVEAVPPALLSDVQFNGHSFILKELQPSSDKMRLGVYEGKWKKLNEVICTMARITAWGHLRSGGRQGSSIADEFMAFGKQVAWKKQLLSFAATYKNKVENDYEAFCKAYDDGYYNPKK
ncbi:MAG TPA: DUF2252 domain-containing protein [Bacteroidia bacterium]|nr:DUF2252 domain-containing protein [Bacteroidia bacterium]